MIAVGTVANAIDDSFETTADLEIMSVDFAPGSGKEMAVKGKVKSSERFHRLAWSGLSSGSSALPLGILAGGMVDGSIGFWNPAIIAKGLCLFLRHTRACMHVRAHACARQCVFVPACPCLCILVSAHIVVHACLGVCTCSRRFAKSVSHPVWVLSGQFSLSISCLSVYLRVCEVACLTNAFVIFSSGGCPRAAGEVLEPHSCAPKVHIRKAQ